MVAWTVQYCKHLKLNNEVLFCKICNIDLFPFSSLNDILMNSRKLSDIELLPSLDIISKTTSLGSLNVSDIESNIPILWILNIIIHQILTN